VGLHLGTFYSAFSNVAQVWMMSCELDCGGPVLDALGLPIPREEVLITPVPEPGLLAFVAYALFALGLLRTSRST
jgi:hypothetical protein